MTVEIFHSLMDSNLQRGKSGEAWLSTYSPALELADSARDSDCLGDLWRCPISGSMSGCRASAIYGASGREPMIGTSTLLALVVISVV